MHNEMYELLDDDIEFIILPYTLGFGKIKGYPYAMTCQSTSILPDIIKATFNTNDKLITPNVLFMAGNEKLLKSECKKFSKKIGLSFQTVFEALEDAFKHYQNYSTTINKSISDKISQLNNTPLIIIAGRPYVTCSNKINFGFPKKITSRGYHVISSDTIDFTSKEGIDDSNIWNYTQQIVNAVHYSKYNPNVYICFVSCFSCGPDSIIYHSVNQELQGKPFCYLEIDSHTADAGFETRVEAFLEIIEESRNN
jgi:predicted nucleotide-binding protein (sugar kinase/HSP70/actin superfamily)